MARISFRVKQFTVLFLILSFAFMGLSFVPRARAFMQIFSVNPVKAFVGSNVTVSGNLTTANGGYKILFDTFVEASGNATGNSVNATFIVPETIFGNHTIFLVDSTTNENASNPFVVNTAFSMNVTVPTAPMEFQEGDSVPIFLYVNGSSANAENSMVVSVETPANVTFTEQDLNISSSALGSGNLTIEFPGDFPASGTNIAGTGYVGTYTVTSNETSGSVSFNVGLTNSTQYHRLQVVNIRAGSYNPNEQVALNVTGSNVQYVMNLTADSAGAINYSDFSVPANASIGTYTVSIVSTAGPTAKTPSDTQVFTVPGFAFNVTAENLAGDVVPNVAISAVENGTTLYNETTGSNGLAVFTLEIGTYNLTGYYKSVDVGENQFQVNGTAAVDLVLNLTDLNVAVVAFVNGAEVGLPDVSINLLPDNVTLNTDVNGNLTDQSLLPNGTTYVLNVTRYNTSFNITTLTGLLVNGSAMPYYNVTIVSPSYTLQVNVFEANGQPFGDASVEAIESVGGIQYNGTTNSNGTVIFNNVTLGEYDVEALDTAGNVINSTTVDLFQDQNATVNCSLYGFSISVTVTDYFGQPFANTDVTLQGNSVGLISNKTQTNGTAVFDNLIGGSFSISVYLSDNSQPTVVNSVAVNGSTAVSIKLDRYVLFAGIPVELSELTIVIIIVLAILLIVVLEMYFVRRKPRVQKNAD